MVTGARRAALLACAVLLLAEPVAGERRVTCRRGCREAVATCAAWRAPLNPRRAKRLCEKELLPRCVLDGLVECERAPHYRGSYIFVGERSGGSCDWPAGGPPRDGPLAVAVTVHNRDRGWIDATMNGTTECAGEGTTLPWTLRTVRGSCLAEGAAGDWCADATLTVEGLPPRTPNAPRPRAIMTFDLVFHEWAHPNTPACAIVYTGDLRIPRF